MNLTPPTRDDLDFINQIFDRYGHDDGILDVSELDGFLVAIVSGPEMIPPSVWFPAIWGGEEGAPDWASEAEFQRFIQVAISMMNFSASLLLERPEKFEALFNVRTVEGEEFFVVEDWCFGYMRGVQLAQQAWEEHALQVAPFLSKIHLFGDEEHFADLEKLSDASIRKLQGEIEPAVRALHAYWLAQRSPMNSPVMASPKVGRNDPCPCGSGKKYKKCCLH